MRLFIDTGSVAEVEEIAAWGVLSGATTNPSLLAKEEGDPGDAIVRICELVNGPVSAEVVSEDADGMIAEGRALHPLHEHIVVKVPFSAAGLQATRVLSDDGIPVNMTLVFSPNQAILSAGRRRDVRVVLHGPASTTSPSIPAEVVAGIVDWPAPRAGPPRRCWRRRSRHPEHVITAAKLGCEVATLAGQGAAPDARPPAHGGVASPSSPPTGALAPSSRSGSRAS